VVTGVCGRQSDHANFGLLSHDPWNMYPNRISSNECSDANYTAVSSNLGSGPTSDEPLYYFPVGFNIQQQAKTKSKGTEFTRDWENSLVKTALYSSRNPVLHTCSYSSNSEQGGGDVTLRGRIGGHSRYEAWSTRVCYTGHSCRSQLAVNDKQRCGDGGRGQCRPAAWSTLKFPPRRKGFVSETISNGFYALPSKLYVHCHSVELNIPNEGCFNGGSGTGFTGCLRFHFTCLFIPLCAVKIQKCL
jgi:hypothetical protein